MITFPPHCSHKLQPLDRSVFGPFKRYYNSYCSSWMKDHPGKPMSIHIIAELVGLAFPLAITPANITSGFRVAGLVPFNRFIFDGDVDFAPSFVTDRPLNSSPIPPIDDFIEIPASNDNIVQEGQNSRSSPKRPNSRSSPKRPNSRSREPHHGQCFNYNSTRLEQHCGYFRRRSFGDSWKRFVEDSNRNPVEIMRPYPKAGPRKGSSTGRKRSTAILTDTPVKA